MRKYTTQLDNGSRLFGNIRNRWQINVLYARSDRLAVSQKGCIVGYGNQPARSGNTQEERF
jgi:hypothetical protein